MHRSGTSLITGVLSLAGLYLGEEDDLIEAGEGNEKGFYEHKDIIKINDEILRFFKGSWAHPPVFNDGWEHDTRFANIENKAKEVIKKMDAKSQVWGFKDPRTCLTLSFWQKVLSGRNLKYIITIRDPLAIAKSIHKRNPDLDVNHGLYLWSRYWLGILRFTSSENRLFTDFDNFFIDWRTELRSIGEYLGEETLSYEDKTEQIQDFISPPLRHHTSGSNKITADKNLNTTFYTALDTHIGTAYEAIYSQAVESSHYRSFYEQCTQENKVLHNKLAQYHTYTLGLENESKAFNTSIFGKLYRLWSDILKKIR